MSSTSDQALHCTDFISTFLDRYKAFLTMTKISDDLIMSLLCCSLSIRQVRRAPRYRNPQYDSRLLYIAKYIYASVTLRRTIAVDQRATVWIAIDGPVCAFREAGERSGKEGGKDNNVQSVELRHCEECLKKESQKSQSINSFTPSKKSPHSSIRALYSYCVTCQHRLSKKERYVHSV
jgi:hypothetical protein